jgi:hypothetical protein
MSGDRYNADEGFNESDNEGDGDSVDSDDVYEMREAGALPQFQKIQEQYKQQLLAEQNRSELAVRGLRNQLVAVDKVREDLGVQLYNAQHQLSRLQLALEKTMGRFTDTVQARVDTEEKSVKMQLDVKEQVARLKRVSH